MITESALFPDVKRVAMAPLNDHRGWLLRLFDAEPFAAAGLPTTWAQQLASFSARRHTLRGLHTQVAPLSEAKLLVPLMGHMWWVVVDVRRASPTFGRWEGFDLIPGGGHGLFVPKGFAHGCLALADNTLLHIMTDSVFSPPHGVGIRWDDPELAIAWPLPAGAEVVMSAEHAAYPSFSSFRTGATTP
ncbi:MAG: dTDP-4-dehydrorhamnose 3,5-epimerase family protein [Alphaproteobacteria bacterium]